MNGGKHREEKKKEAGEEIQNKDNYRSMNEDGHWRSPRQDVMYLLSVTLNS